MTITNEIVSQDIEWRDVAFDRGAVAEVYATVNGRTVTLSLRWYPRNHLEGRWQLSMTPQFGPPPWLSEMIKQFDIEEAKASALALAEQILKPYADAYAAIVETRKQTV